MLRIAICDDEEYFCKKIEETVLDYIKETDVSCDIELFSSGKEFLALGIGITAYSIIFLDINMDGIDGMTTARKIREVNRDMFIVFVTAFMDYVLEGYQVDAIRYVLKENAGFQSSVYECMDAIINKMNYKLVKKEFKFREGIRNISLERLLYIESKLHRLDFYVMEKTMKCYTTYDTLNEIEKKLEGNRFIRIHQSFLVNLKYIKAVERYKVLLHGGKNLIISKARYQKVKEAFIVYQGEI